MNDTLLERYSREPVAVREELEAAARRERARHIRRFLEQSAQALFGTRCSPNSGKKEFLSGQEAGCGS